MIKRYPFSVVAAIVIFIITTLTLYYTNVFDYSQFISILIGLVVTTLNFFGGILSAQISLKKSEKAFIKIVFGSMVIRLFLMLIIILIILVFLDINRNSFIFSIFIFYIFYLLIEVFYLKNRTN